MSTQDPDIGWTLDDEQYALVEAEIAKNAPRVFAMCEFERDEEDGELVAGHVLAWGLQFADYAEVVDATGRFHGSIGSLNCILELLSSGPEDVGLAWPGAQQHRTVTTDDATAAPRR